MRTVRPLKQALSGLPPAAPPLTPLRSMPDADRHVVYFGTSSKILTRGLRVSWAVLPARFRAAMTAYLDSAGEDVSQVRKHGSAHQLPNSAMPRRRTAT